MDAPRLSFSPNPALSASLRRLGEATSTLLQESMSSGVNMVSRAGQVADAAASVPASASRTTGSVREVPCCPPTETCPPYCLIEITRRAHPGEMILVPFRVRNASGQPKTYHFGVRPMVDEHQNPAPSQPTLDKLSATINPHQAVLVEMKLDLRAGGYQAGQQYEATIVVREKEINQNICFRLLLDPFTGVPEATPLDEQELKTHFVSWHYHFYCDEQPARVTFTQPPLDVEPAKVKKKAVKK